MSRSMLYLLGEPGVGKTTLVRRLTKGIPGEVMKAPYISWTHYSPRVCQLGYDREAFGGTDALGMAAQNHVLAWLETCPYTHVLAEGDRLANAKFFYAVMHTLGWNLKVVVLKASEDTLEARRSVRSAELGRTQDERWLKTRRTKVANLTAEADIILNAEETPTALARQLTSQPVVRALLKLRR